MNMSLRRPALIGYAALMAIAACLLSPFFAVALYSGPFTDDFCMSSRSFHHTLAEIAQYYLTVSGRLPALLLITLPSDLAHLTGLDLYVVYPLVMVLLLAAFVSAIALASVLVFRQTVVGILFGLLFSVFALAMVPSLKEFAYWMPGVACYLTAAAGVCLYAGWLAAKTTNDEPIKNPNRMALLCFITAALNEFTVFFLLGITCLSAAIRLLSPKQFQVRPYLLLIAATVAGYCIILLAPGNSHRMALFQNNDNIIASFHNASQYSLEYALYLIRLRQVYAFAALCGCFALIVPPAARLPAFLFAIGLFGLAVVWVYVSYFIGAFATGDVIPMRARNELLVVFLFCCSLSGILLVRAAIGPHLAALPRFGIVAIGTLFILPMRDLPNFDLMQKQWPVLSTFWEESIARDFLLSSSPYDDLLVPKRTVFPSLLMGEELKETSDSLPNDCMGRYYGRSSVTLLPAP
jgi:hypothetical protein